MKIMKYLSALLCIAGCVVAQEAPVERTYPAQITFRVKTDMGEPVSNVEVGVSTFLRWEPGEGFGRDINQTFTEKTNKDGIAIIHAESKRGRFGYGVKDTPGFYRDYGDYYKFNEVKEGRWEPWNPVIDVVLKPIIKPIPMYARKMGDITRLLELPVAAGQSVGFDLMVAEWVAPYGKGKVADLVFTLNELVPLTDAENPFDYTLTLTFANEGDGIQSVFAPPHKGSDLRLPRFAPEGGYEAKLEKRIGRSARGQPLNTGTREDQNYFFRVRTVLDEQGRIKSALYGKISGDMACDVINSRKGYVIFTYYLNPTSLDRNLEFDPQHNLSKGLRRSEKINEP